MGVLQCHWTSIFCHTRVRAPPCSMYLQPCGYEAWESSCTCPSCPFTCTMVTGQQAAFLLTACSQTCRHTCCEGHALRSVFSQFVHFLLQRPCDILKTSSASSSPSAGLTWPLFFFCMFSRLCSISTAERRHTAVL